MKREILFSMESPYRDTFRIQGFRFGEGEKTLAIVGAMRGDEIQQQYICSQLVRHLLELENQGKLANDYQILIVPSANPFSMNIEKRFWAMDNTDINRMFPGYNLGETTQRIASGLFEAIKDFKYGIQLTSFYVPGNFIPHIRLQKTGYEDIEGAKLFGMPYISIRKPKPYDTTLLNYNWQIWGCKAYSLYSGQNDEISSPEAASAINTIMRYMQRIGLTTDTAKQLADFNSVVIDEKDLISVITPTSGIFKRVRNAGHVVEKGDTLAYIIDPYEGSVKSEIKSPTDGVIFFSHNKATCLQNTPLFKIYDGTPI